MLTATEITTKLHDLNLTTPRLRLRRLTPADEQVQLDHELNPAIMSQIRDPLPRDEVIKRLNELNDAQWQAAESKWLGLAIEESDTNAFTGLFFIRIESYDNQTVEIGYRLHPDYWGRGYATEAGLAVLDFLAHQLDVRKVVAYCVADNEGSARVMTKLGLEREGCLRQHSCLAGRWQDELVYGRLLQDAAKP